MTELWRVAVVSWLLLGGCQGVKPPVKASEAEQRPAVASVDAAVAKVEPRAGDGSAVQGGATGEPADRGGATGELVDRGGAGASAAKGEAGESAVKGESAGESAVKAEGGPGPLDAAQRASLLAGDEERIFSKREHFTVSNEYRHDLWFPYLRGLGGVYVGVASDQNYTLMAVAESEIGYLIDLDRQVVHLHRVYMTLIAASEDPELFLRRFGGDAAARAETRALLEAGLSDMSERDRAAALAFVDENREALREYLQAVRNTKRGEQGVTWLADPTLYQYMRRMVAGGRLRAINGNLAGKKAMATIAAGARALGQSVKLLYLSNAEEYLSYTPDFVANVRALPAEPGSVVLRTIHDRFEGWESCGDGDRRWNYQVQPLTDFQARLGDRKNTARTAMLARANAEKVIDRVARGVSVFKSPAP